MMFRIPSSLESLFPNLALVSLLRGSITSFCPSALFPNLGLVSLLMLSDVRPLDLLDTNLKTNYNPDKFLNMLEIHLIVFFYWHVVRHEEAAGHHLQGGQVLSHVFWHLLQHIPFSYKTTHHLQIHVIKSVKIFPTPALPVIKQ